MEYDAETLALLEKYPTLRKPFEEGIESHDGREAALLAYIKAHPCFHSFKNNPQAILKAIDDFSYKHDFLISIGAHKAEVLSTVIAQQKPRIAIELGGYLGYSAMVLADAMGRVDSPHASKEGSDLPGIHVWSLELNADFAAIARELIDLAGLGDLITVVTGAAEESLQELKAEGKVKTCDLLFLDHVEEMYTVDFKVCERLGLLREGSVIIADNVVKPGAPEYRSFVRNHAALKSEGVRGLIQPGDGEVTQS